MAIFAQLIDIAISLLWNKKALQQGNFAGKKGNLDSRRP